MTTCATSPAARPEPAACPWPPPAGRAGPWSIEHLDAQDARLEAHATQAGGSYPCLLHDGELVAGATPRLIQEHQPLVDAARARGGHVLVAGLGVGLDVHLLLELPQVETVTVVELDVDVVALAWPRRRRRRAQLVVGDVRTWEPPSCWRPFSCGWLDVWPTDAGSTELERLELWDRWRPWCEWLGGWPMRQLTAGGTSAWPPQAQEGARRGSK